MGASSNLAAKSWLWSWKTRVTSGCDLPVKRLRTRWVLMANVLASGLSRSAVEELSRQKGEPAWMLQKRLHAWEVYENTPAPLGRRGDLGTLRAIANFKFQELTPYVPANGGRPQGPPPNPTPLPPL